MVFRLRHYRHMYVDGKSSTRLTLVASDVIVREFRIGVPSRKSHHSSDTCALAPSELGPWGKVAHLLLWTRNSFLKNCSTVHWNFFVILNWSIHV